MMLGLEGQEGLEPSTPCLKGRCSNQLSYWPDSGFLARVKVPLKTPYIIAFLAKKSTVYGYGWWHICHRAQFAVLNPQCLSTGYMCS